MTPHNPTKQPRTPGLILGALLGATVVGLVMALLLMTGLVSGGMGAASEGKGYASPEEAVDAYMVALADADPAAAARVFAVETALKHTDQKALLKLTRAALPGAAQPGEDPLSQTLMATDRLAYVNSTIRNQIYSLLLPDQEREQIVRLEDDAAVSDYLRTSTLNPDDLAAAREYTLTDPATLTEPSSLEHLQKIDAPWQRAWGLAESRYLVATTELKGVRQHLIFSLGRYGDRWYALDLGGRLASVLGVPFINAGVLRAEG